jgi:preprotein translocase subunit Sec63
MVEVVVHHGEDQLQFHVQVEEEVETDLIHQVKIVFQEKMVIQEDLAEELLEDLEERQLHQVVVEFQEKETTVDKELKTGADTLEVEAVIILLHLIVEELLVMG